MEFIFLPKDGRTWLFFASHRAVTPLVLAPGEFEAGVFSAPFYNPTQNPGNRQARQAGDGDCQKERWSLLFGNATNLRPPAPGDGDHEAAQHGRDRRSRGAAAEEHTDDEQR